MTSKMIELLISIAGILDSFLDKIVDTIVYGDGIGAGTIGYLNVVSTAIFLCLTAAFIWNIMEAVVTRAKAIGDVGQMIPWTQLKKCVQILIIGSLMYGASAVFYKNPKGGSYLGVGYQGMVQGLSNSTMNAAMNTLGAVDIVDNWNECINEFQVDRREKILQAIAAQDPKVGETYRARLAFSNDPTNAPMSLLDKVKTGWDTAQSALSGKTTLYVLQFVVNAITTGWCYLVVMICEFFFIFQAGRTILILAFYVKLASILTMIVLPSAIGLLYFERMRHFAITIIKQIVVLSLVAGILGGAVQTVFSQATIKEAMTVSMREDLAPYLKKIGTSDIMAFETVTDIEATMKMFSKGADLSMIDHAATMSVKQNMTAMVSMIKIMFILGSMLMVIAKLFDLVTGILAGYWDPFSEGSKAAG